MVEYAKRISDGVEVKIGTCETMYYLRYEDRRKVLKVPNSLDPRTEKDLFWRLPFPDEDKILIGQYQPFERGERLWKTSGEWTEDFSFSDVENVDAGQFQMYHKESGLIFSVPCHHGMKLPDMGPNIKPGWNGKSWALELVYLKNTAEAVWPVVRCRFCGSMWRFTWEEILPYLHGELKSRLEIYAPKAAVV